MAEMNAHVGRTHRRAGAVLVGLLLAGFAPLGCIPLDPDAACSADLQARVGSLEAATDSLVAAAAELKAGVAGACLAIATDLGESVEPLSSEVTDAELEGTCQQATAALDARINAGASIRIYYQPAYCSVSAEAQFACEASCDVEGSCDPGSVDVRCSPGELSVVCDPEVSCQAGAYCQGSVEVAANCQGSCSATCQGDCMGSCSATGADGSCQGYCEGTCMGSCTGQCKIEADAGIACGAEVRCKGGCTVESYSAPRCEAELQPPNCDIDADCQAGCDGAASFEATCTEPEVVIEGEANAELVATLEANLPAILDGLEGKGRLVADAAADVASSAEATADALGDSLVCAAFSAGDVAASLRASAEASVSVSVSVQASASVSASAGVN